MDLGVRSLTLSHVDNEGADQPAHVRSLISAFVVHFPEITIYVNLQHAPFIHTNTWKLFSNSKIVR